MFPPNTSEIVRMLRKFTQPIKWRTEGTEMIPSPKRTHAVAVALAEPVVWIVGTFIHKSIPAYRTIGATTTTRGRPRGESPTRASSRPHKSTARASSSPDSGHERRSQLRDDRSPSSSSSSSSTSDSSRSRSPPQKKKDHKQDTSRHQQTRKDGHRHRRSSLSRSRSRSHSKSPKRKTEKRKRMRRSTSSESSSESSSSDSDSSPGEREMLCITSWCVVCLSLATVRKRHKKKHSTRDRKHKVHV